eukprot:80990_1
MKASVIAVLVYILISSILLVIVCYYGWKTINQGAYLRQLKSIKRSISLISLFWKMKNIYINSLLHMCDIGTHLGILVYWGIQTVEERNGGDDKNVRGVNMMGLFVSSLVVFLLYSLKRAYVQFLDLEIYNAIYVTHKLYREEEGTVQRWLQKTEAIFQSAPMALLQLVYIVKTADY